MTSFNNFWLVELFNSHNAATYLATPKPPKLSEYNARNDIFTYRQSAEGETFCSIPVAVVWVL